jgi:hypothetical protein
MGNINSTVSTTDKTKSPNDSGFFDNDQFIEDNELNVNKRKQFKKSLSESDSKNIDFNNNNDEVDGGDTVSVRDFFTLYYCCCLYHVSLKRDIIIILWTYLFIY